MTDLYRPLRDEFAWYVPRYINIAERCCQQWAALPSHARASAIEVATADGLLQSLSFQDLWKLTARLSHGLERMGAKAGDRVAVIMRDRVEALAAMMACWVNQCIAVPVGANEHGDVIAQRVRQSRCRIAFIDDTEPDKILAALQRCTRVQQIVGLALQADNVMAWTGLLARQSDSISVPLTRAQQPALLVWPHRPSSAYPPQTAYLMAHQALIGNLPGFVAANNWFPKDATGMVTTWSLLSETGLLGTILPSLYFGVGVRIVPSTPQFINGQTRQTLKPSHLCTTAGILCRWLKHEAVWSGPELSGLCAVGEHLGSYWRQLTEERFGVAPNLASYVTGCGILWGDSHEKWPSDPDGAGRVFPGHQIVPGGESDERPSGDLAGCAEFQVSRSDELGHADPAVYVSVWPLKDPADMLEPVDIAAIHPSGLLGTLHKDGSLSIAGCFEDALMINKRIINPLRLEQVAMTFTEVAAAAAIQPAVRKGNQDTDEIWLVIELSPKTDLATAIRTELGSRILHSLAGLAHPGKLRLGITQKISTDANGNPRRDLLRLRHGLSGVQPLHIPV